MPDLNLPSALGFPGPRLIQSLVELWSPNPANHIGAQILPELKWDMPFIEWDELAGVEGMTNAHSLDADVKATIMEVLKTYKENPFYWREVAWLKESDLLTARMMGSLNPKAGMQLYMRTHKSLNTRLDTRREWCRWQALTGSLAIDENGVKRTLTYGVQAPAAPSVTWDTVATADPMADLQTYLALLDGWSSGNARIYYGRDVGNALSQNAKVRSLASASGFAKELSASNVGQALVSAMTGDIESMQLYKEGYKSGGNFAPFIPAKHIVIVGNSPDSEPIGHHVTTLAVQNGGLANPRAGRFEKTMDKLDEKGKFGVLVGENSVPIIKHPKCVIKLQVLA